MSDGVIVLRRSEERDVPLIADASNDPKARKWLDDEPLTAERLQFDDEESLREPFGLPASGRSSSASSGSMPRRRPRSVASIRAIEKAGFRREGLSRDHCETHGRRHDCVMFSIVRAIWLTTSSAAALG
jgi:hypothetical protein